MFHFEADIVKRKKISKSSLLFGLLSAGLLGYLGITFLEAGAVPIIETIIEQIGFQSYSTWIYMGVFALLALLIIPAVRTIMQKKVVVGGHVAFDEKNLKIVKGKENFLIPEEDLNQLNFELKPLPSGNGKKKEELFGGSWMKIPTKKGTFECELNIDTSQKKEKLLEMIEFLKIEHDVEVKLKELK
ncbi:MAG: hypothetical protein AAF985_05330 [Bacteroidota bacterium]